MRVPDPRGVLRSTRALHDEIADDPRHGDDGIIDLVTVSPPVDLAARGLARAVTIAIATGTPDAVELAIARPGVVAAWRGFDTYVAEWIRPAGLSDTAQLGAMVARKRVPWFIDVEETRRYHVIFPDVLVNAGDRVDWHAWASRAGYLVSRPHLAGPMVPWRDAAGPLPDITWHADLYPDQVHAWFAVLDPTPRQRDQVHALACCHPFATVIEGEGTFRMARGVREHVKAIIVSAFIPGAGMVEHLSALGGCLAKDMALPGDRFMVVPPAWPVPIDRPPGYPDDPVHVFRRDAKGKWIIAPSMNKGRCLTLAEQWERMHG